MRSTAIFGHSVIRSCVITIVSHRGEWGRTVECRCLYDIERWVNHCPAYPRSRFDTVQAPVAASDRGTPPLPQITSPKAISAWAASLAARPRCYRVVSDIFIVAVVASSPMVLLIWAPTTGAADPRSSLHHAGPLCPADGAQRAQLRRSSCTRRFRTCAIGRSIWPEMVKR